MALITSTVLSLNPKSVFTTGFNNTGDSTHEVIEHMPNGIDRVILKGLSRTKAAAIAMILSARE